MTASAASPSPSIVHNGLPQPERNRAIWAIALSVGLATLDTAIANTALPEIATDLMATPAASVWIVNAYQLAMVAMLLPCAALGEILGYRRVYITGLIVFTIASLACALSPTLAMLTAARVLQGLGAAAVMSVNTALLRFVYPSRMLGRGLGLNAMIVAIAFAVGPTMASLILTFGKWPWLFAVNVPIGIVAFLLGSKTLPHTEKSSNRFDPLVAIFCGGAFSLLLLALGEGAHATGWLQTLITLAAALICVTLLLKRQAGHPAPMFPIDLFRRPMFTLSVLTAICSFAAQGLAFVALPFYFQSVLGRTQVETGFLMTPWPVVVAFMGPIAGRLSDKYPASILGGIGMVLLAIGLILMALMPAAPSVLDICWRMAICGAGFGFFQAPNLKAIMSSAPPERAGGASGMVATGRLVGQTTGAALVALCFIINAQHGPALALGLGALFAAAACVASFSRLFADKKIV